ncbi:LSAMP.2 family protein [Megaselia abdita]
MCPTGQSKSYPLANPGFNIHGDDAFNQYNIYNNDMDLNERYNDWREFIIAAKDYNHNLIQRAYHVIWNLLPDQYYEAKVMSKNRHGWSEWTPNFGFSTTGNEHIMRDSSLLSSYDSGSQKSYYTKFHFAFQLLILFISSTIQQLL